MAGESKPQLEIMVSNTRRAKRQQSAYYFRLPASGP
jgi:hypothetical protein